MFASVVAQLLNGLAGASSLFLVAAGLTLIFGVTRVVNFAHGSLYMLGAYGAYALIDALPKGALGFWGGVLIAAVAVAALGALIEVLLLRRIYQAPELLQLAATFGVVLIVRDAALAIWGAEDLLGPRAPGFRGAVDFVGRAVPTYELLLLALGPLVLVALWLLIARTRFGVLVRAATENRVLVGALGIDERRLFTLVFALGAFLAGAAGALQLPREPANLGMDLAIIAEAFVVTVVGGLGSIPGAFVAALIIGLTKALCIAAGTVTLGDFSIAFPKLTLAAEFVVMAVVLAVRPHGLAGSPLAPAPVTRVPEQRTLVLPPGRRSAIAAFAALILAALLPLAGDEYTLILATDVLIVALFAASLQFMMGPGGMASFGHAAYFGLGAYAAAIAVKHGLPMEVALALAPAVALAGALLFGWFCVRLSGVYLAMLTLAFAQIVWSIAFQWDAVTGGSNGLVGVWPAAWLGSKLAYYGFVLAVTAGALAALAWLAHAPFGYSLRAARDSPLRAEAVGIDVRSTQWSAFAAGRHVRRACRRPLRVFEGQHFAGNARDSTLGRRARRRAARWSQRARRTADRRRGFHVAFGHARARDRILARGNGGCNPADRARVPDGPRRRMAAHGFESRAVSTPTLAVDRIAKSFGGVDAVREVSFTVAAGELVALIGPNGAGKTTCFNLVNGQLAPDAGTITLVGRRIDGLPPREVARAGVGRTFQVAATFASMSVRENVQVALLAHAGLQNGVASRATDRLRDEADALLARVGMTRLADQGCATLAYGDAKRVELALALANAPRLLLMDEPTAGMSPRARTRLMQLAVELARHDGIAVLFTEHDMDVVFGHADRVLVLDKGRLIAQGTPDAIRADARVQAVYLGEDAVPAPR